MSASGFGLCWTAYGLTDYPSVGYITYPVETETRGVYVVSSSASQPSVYVAITKHRRRGLVQARTIAGRTVPFLISDTTTTARSISQQNTIGTVYAGRYSRLASRSRLAIRRRGWGYAAAWLGFQRPDDVDQTRLLACAEMAVGKNSCA